MLDPKLFSVRLRRFRTMTGMTLQKVSDKSGVNIATITGAEPFEVAAIGMACVLIHTRVFREVRQKFGNNFHPIGYNSEDTSFMWKARKCGFKVFVDPSLNIGHVGQYVFGKERMRE